MEQINLAIQALKNNDVIGLPTETVYGLAADITSEEGINKIFATKERPFFDPLIVHISSTQQAKKCSRIWNEDCDQLANTFWPGPLTLILPKNNDLISDLITSGLDTVGLRMPQHKLALELIEKLGNPVAAPSANKFKKTSPTSAEHVKKAFPSILVIDGGDCSIGIESTILGFENDIPVIYRPGMITSKDIEKCLQKRVLIKESPIAPGHLKHHYMPETPIIMGLVTSQTKELPPQLTSNLVKWELPKDAALAARNLYSKFRELDQKQYSAIYITFTKEQFEAEEFRGIFNRLTKAASFDLTK